MATRTPSWSASIRNVSQPARKKDKAKDEESEIELGELAQPRVDETIEPPPVYQCTDRCRHATNPEELILSDGGARIRVIVGTAPARKTFLIHKSVLTSHSGYFKTALRDGNEDRFIEADRGEFVWPDDDPEDFYQFVRWMYSCGSCRLWDVYDLGHVCKTARERAENPYSWCSEGAEAEHDFVLGDRIVAVDYSAFALASFIQHVHLIDPQRIVWVYENVRDGSGLHRFVVAWLGWMKFKLDKKDEVPDGMEEAAAVFAPVFDSLVGWVNVDPRRYLIEHWTEPGPTCLVRSPWEPSYCGHMVSHIVTQLGCRRGGALTPSQMRRQKMLKGVISVWYCSCMVMLVMSTYIFARDRDGLIARWSKVLSVISACFAFLGMCTRGDLFSWVSIPTGLVGFPAAMLSSFQAASCFQNATSSTSICKIQTGFAAVEMVYCLALSAVVTAWLNRTVVPLGT